jgi:hypothetical protein
MLLNWLGRAYSCTRVSILDHTKFALDYQDKLAVTEPEKKSLYVGWKPWRWTESRHCAAVIVYERWHQLSDEGVTEATQNKVMSLGDQTHAFGVARLACVIEAVVAGCIIFAEHDWTSTSLLWASLFLVVLFLGFHTAFVSVGRKAHEMFERALRDAIENKEPRSMATPTQAATQADGRGASLVAAPGAGTTNQPAANGPDPTGKASSR